MAGDLLLALDLGTTSVRALVVAPDGEVRGRAQRPLEVRFPEPGRVEQDARQWETRGSAVLREALTAAGASARDVAGLGIVTQRATAVAWDAVSGEPLAPALGWQDQRAAAWAATLRARGTPMTAQASLGRFVWLLEHAPAVRRAAAAGRLRMGNPDAWLGWRLSAGDAHATDPGHASCTGLYDLRRGDWSARSLAAFGIEADWLPRVVASAEIVGETPASLLGASVPLAARAGDQQAAAFAQGVHAPGLAKLTLGTGAMLDLHTGAAPCDARQGTATLALWRLPRSADAFCLEGTVLSAGAALDWLVSLGLARDAAALEKLAGAAATSAGVIFVPALQGLGTPFADDAARGFLGGLTRGSNASHLARAAFTGVAQRCADLCEALPVTAGPLRVDGGAARSRLLVQQLADLTGREIWRAAEAETTALGAALLAGLGAGTLPDAAACAARLAPPDLFAPARDAAWRERERERWRRIVAERVVGALASPRTQTAG